MAAQSYSLPLHYMPTYNLYVSTVWCFFFIIFAHQYCLLLSILCFFLKPCLRPYLFKFLMVSKFPSILFQDLLFLACSHPENRTTMTSISEWPEWILEVLIYNHEVSIVGLFFMSEYIARRIMLHFVLSTTHWSNSQISNYRWVLRNMLMA